MCMWEFLHRRLGVILRKRLLWSYMSEGELSQLITLGLTAMDPRGSTGLRSYFQIAPEFSPLSLGPGPESACLEAAVLHLLAVSVECGAQTKSSAA